LDEIIYQGISNDMAVPILALDHFRKRAKRAFDFSPELEILRTAGNKPALEVDVCCLMDGSLIVGEAKTAPILAKVRKEERIMIANYRELAADIGASTVVFATIAPSWDTITRQEIDKAFSGDRIKPFILSGSDLN